MLPSRQEFVRQMYVYAVETITGSEHTSSVVDPRAVGAVAVTGTVQACHESHWGESRGFVLRNNPLGIKPAGEQPASDDGKIRIFDTVADAWEAWAYLVGQSSHYSRARKYIDGSKGEVQPHMWEGLFFAVYCPVDKDYLKKIEALLREVLPVLRDLRVPFRAV